MLVLTIGIVASAPIVRDGIQYRSSYSRYAIPETEEGFRGVQAFVLDRKTGEVWVVGGELGRAMKRSTTSAKPPRNN